MVAGWYSTLPLHSTPLVIQLLTIPHWEGCVRVLSLRAWWEEGREGEKEREGGGRGHGEREVGKEREGREEREGGGRGKEGRRGKEGGEGRRGEREGREEREGRGEREGRKGRRGKEDERKRIWQDDYNVCTQVSHTKIIGELIRHHRACGHTLIFYYYGYCRPQIISTTKFSNLWNPPALKPTTQLGVWEIGKEATTYLYQGRMYRLERTLNTQFCRRNRKDKDVVKRCSHYWDTDLLWKLYQANKSLVISWSHFIRELVDSLCRDGTNAQYVSEVIVGPLHHVT